MINYDDQARRDFKENPKSAVFWYVVSSYAYYIRGCSLLSDETFDKLCKVILERKIQHSKLSHLYTDDDLRAGTGYAIPIKKYPNFIAYYGEMFIRNLDEKVNYGK
jgi:hypothetical protein